MSAPNCLRTLVRPSTGVSGIQGIPVSAPRTTAASASIALARTRTAPFSTTAANARPPPVKKDADKSRTHARGGKKLVLNKFKKDKVAEKGRPPQPGERKAYRKRITLSNDNAIAVPWLADLAPADMTKPENTAKVLAIPEETQDQLRASEAFKSTQCWGMFRKPAVLVRKETVDLANRMQNAAGKKQTLRLVVGGDKLAGKSMMLLQAMTHAYLNNWIVIHVPEGSLFLLSHHRVCGVEKS
jgi:small subunit ribosomal protein S29